MCRHFQLSLLSGCSTCTQAWFHLRVPSWCPNGHQGQEGHIHPQSQQLSNFLYWNPYIQLKVSEVGLGVKLGKIRCLVHSGPRIQSPAPKRREAVCHCVWSWCENFGFLYNFGENKVCLCNLGWPVALNPSVPGPQMSVCTAWLIKIYWQLQKKYCLFLEIETEICVYLVIRKSRSVSINIFVRK